MVVLQNRQGHFIFLIVIDFTARIVMFVDELVYVIQ